MGTVSRRPTRRSATCLVSRSVWKPRTGKCSKALCEVDIFALHEGTDIDAPTVAPLRPQLPALRPQADYVFDIVLRTLTLGHLFTEGTADSNQVWLEVTATTAGRVLGKSGGMAADGVVDPWSHFVNAYVLDRDGNRIDRRNAEDIFTPLYNHQIPPGAASTVHFALRTPADLDAPLTLTVRLRYRKFDTTYLRHFGGDESASNTLPVVTIAADSVTFPVVEAEAGAAQAGAAEEAAAPPEIPAWERWNDYGIGLLRKPERGALKQAEAAFRSVAALGRADGDLNLARVLIREGRLDEAADALRKAAAGGAHPWSVAWFGAQVDMQNGAFDAAIDALTRLKDTRFTEARRRGFDFSRDYRLLNALGSALFERAKLAPAPGAREQWLNAAAESFAAALQEDPENAAAHYGLAQVHARLGNAEDEQGHRQAHDRYRPDDNALDPCRGTGARPATPPQTMRPKPWSCTTCNVPARTSCPVSDAVPDSQRSGEERIRRALWWSFAVFGAVGVGGGDGDCAARRSCRSGTRSRRPSCGAEPCG